jgi:hypothetical protein
MFPVTHAVIGVAAAKVGERVLPARWLPLDYRFAALGGLLPDLIDKPLAWYAFPSLPDDHLWAHSVWLPASLIALGFLVGHRSADARLLLLGLGALTHLLFDPVGADPNKLFWPLFGTDISYARGYLFAPVNGVLIEMSLAGGLLLLPRLYEPSLRRLSVFVYSGAV